MATDEPPIPSPGCLTGLGIRDVLSPHDGHSFFQESRPLNTPSIASTRRNSEIERYSTPQQHQIYYPPTPSSHTPPASPNSNHSAQSSSLHSSFTTTSSVAILPESERKAIERKERHKQRARENHKTAEHNRRNHQKDSVGKLRVLVPGCENASKAELLERTVAYVQDLQHRLEIEAPVSPKRKRDEDDSEVESKVSKTACSTPKL
jgi:Helix-loop-helix DNA-binding domain